MYVALTIKNEHITADQINKEGRKEAQQPYFCPGCHEKVFLKSGKIIQAHFAHFTHSNCSLFSEGETQEHLSGKKLLFEWCQKAHIPCQLEAYLPRLKQRPDLLIWPDAERPVAIEFQCSPLSIEKMLERTEGYRKNGYEVLWIAGSKFQLKKQLTPFQQTFLRSHHVLGIYFICLKVDERLFKVYTNLSVTQPGCSVKKQIFTVDFHGLNNLLHDPGLLTQPRKTIETFSYQKSHEYLIRGRLYQNQKMIEFQKYIYYHGYSLISLPKEVYIPIENEWIIKTIPHFWKSILLEWIKEMGSGEIFSKEDLHAKIEDMKKNKEIEFYFSPCIEESIKAKIFSSYLWGLEKSMIVTSLSSTEWLITNTPHSYIYEREKLAEFEKLDQKERSKIKN